VGRLRGAHCVISGITQLATLTHSVPKTRRLLTSSSTQTHTCLRVRFGALKLAHSEYRCASQNHQCIAILNKLRKNRTGIKIGKAQPILRHIYLVPANDSSAIKKEKITTVPTKMYTAETLIGERLFKKSAGTGLPLDVRILHLSSTCMVASLRASKSYQAARRLAAAPGPILCIRAAARHQRWPQLWKWVNEQMRIRDPAMDRRQKRMRSHHPEVTENCPHYKNNSSKTADSVANPYLSLASRLIASNPTLLTRSMNQGAPLGSLELRGQDYGFLCRA
jgi:hypothetical protein